MYKKIQKYTRKENRRKMKNIFDNFIVNAATVTTARRSLTIKAQCVYTFSRIEKARDQLPIRVSTTF